MKAIIIGAGRGRRLEHLTENEPKCFTQICGRSILDWILNAFSENGMRDIVFVGGYLIDIVKRRYKNLRFRHNTEWANNNILQSLFYAEGDMDGGFISSYADILYTPKLVRKLQDSNNDITIAIDTAWEIRYKHRSLHPPSDAEKVIVTGDQVLSVTREITPSEAHGEFIGLARFSTRGANLLKRYYARAMNDEGAFSAPLRKAYLIHLLDYMIQDGVPVHCVTTDGEYIEVDTLEDYQYANIHWRTIMNA